MSDPIWKTETFHPVKLQYRQNHSSVKTIAQQFELPLIARFSDSSIRSQNTLVSSKIMDHICFTYMQRND